MVRKRKTEIDEMHSDVPGPIFDRIVAIVHDIEEGRRTCEGANLDELAAFVADAPARPPDARPTPAPPRRRRAPPCAQPSTRPPARHRRGRPRRRPAEPTDAVVRVVRACVCGSDLWS